MTKLLGIAMIMTAAVAIASHAQARPRHFTGAGAETCARFVARAGPDGLADPESFQWVLGYLTGRALEVARHRAFHGPEGIAHEIVNWCRAHPRHQVDEAAASLFDPDDNNTLIPEAK